MVYSCHYVLNNPTLNMSLCHYTHNNNTVTLALLLCFYFITSSHVSSLPLPHTLWSSLLNHDYTPWSSLLIHDYTPSSLRIHDYILCPPRPRLTPTVALKPLLRILHEVGCRPSNKQQQLTQVSELSPDRRANSGGPAKLFFSSSGRQNIAKVAATD